MQRVEVSHRYQARPDQVWKTYTDHAGWKHWAGFQTSYLETEATGPEGPNGSGAVRVLGSVGVNAVEEILDFEPPKRMTYRIVRGGLPMKNHLGEVTLEPDGEGTRVTWRCQFESKIPGLGALMRIAITGIFRRALAGLERHGFAG